MKMIKQEDMELKLTIERTSNHGNDISQRL